MKKSLAVPLTIVQIEAANKLHERLPQWKDTDSALHNLNDRFPEFGIQATLLKVAAINQLYGTNVYAVDRMARHILNVLNSGDTLDDIALVETIAALPERKHISFASKFAHFFINAQRFPIYDSIAISMIKFHLGPGEWVKDDEHEYRAFLQNLDALIERVQPPLPCDYQALDRYLWPAGLYKKEKTKPESEDKQQEDKPEINREVWNLFKALSSEGYPFPPLSELLPPEFANLKPRKRRKEKGKKQ